MQYIRSKNKRFAKLLVFVLAVLMVFSTIVTSATQTVLPNVGRVAEGQGSAMAFQSNRGIYSTWETAKGFTLSSSDAKWGYRLEETSETTYNSFGITPNQTEGLAVMTAFNQQGNVDIDNYYAFPAPKSIGGAGMAQPYGMEAGPYKIWNPQKRDYDLIDIKVSVIKNDSRSQLVSSDSDRVKEYVYLEKSSKPNLILANVVEAIVQRDYYYAGTTEPYTLYSNYTYNDIDNFQYVGYDTNGTDGMYASRTSRLCYYQPQGFHIFFSDEAGNDTTGTPNLAAGVKYSGSSIRTMYGTKDDPDTTTWAFYGQTAYDMNDTIAIEDPYKKVVKKGTTDEKESITLEDKGETFEFRVWQRIPAGINASVSPLTKLTINDDVEECLKIDESSVKVYNLAGTDVTAWFNTSVSGQAIKASALPSILQHQNFYGGGSAPGSAYRLTFDCNVDETVSTETFKNHGHLTTTSTGAIRLNFTNIGYTEINDFPETYTTPVAVEVPSPDLEINKTTKRYEHQVVDMIGYEVEVKHSTKSEAGADNVVIQDTDLPEGIDMDESTLTASGISSDFTLTATKGGFVLNAKKLKLDETAKITFDCSIDKKHNGTIVDNVASVTADNMDKKEDDATVYINNPKLKTTKSTDKKEYKPGEDIKYKVEIENENVGTFMRDIVVEDTCTTEGVTLKADTIKVADSKGNDITKDCDITTSGNAFKIKTNKNLAYTDGKVPPQDAGKSPYDAEKYETKLTVTYNVSVDDHMLAGKTIDNIVLTPSTPNTNDELIVDDPDIPSGGDRDDSTVTVKEPVLSIEKTSDKDKYYIGDTGTYKLVVKQLREGLLALNVVITDKIEIAGVEYQQNTIKVMHNGADITETCDITWGEKGFEVKTNKNLAYGEEMIVTYDVLFKDKSLDKQKVKNIAIASSDNTSDVEDDHDTTPEKGSLTVEIEEPGDDIAGGYLDNGIFGNPTTGDYVMLGLLVAAIIAAITATIILKRRRIQKTTK